MVNRGGLPAPEVFDQRDEDGIVVLQQENPPAETPDDVAQAVRVCPGLTIQLEHSGSARTSAWANHRPG